jgi:phosphorylated adapter RNA export protein
VEAIEKCGGQTTADGSRFRTGGGILWNILKSREPKAYKQIMAKGKELEVLFYFEWISSYCNNNKKNHK